MSSAIDIFLGADDEGYSREPSTGRRMGVWATVVVLVLLAGLFWSGLLSRGYESKNISYSSISGFESGWSIGSKTVFLRQGETFVVDYDVQADKGSLMLFVKNVWAPLKDDPEQLTRVSSDSHGELRVPIRKSGFYRLHVAGTPGGDGYDLTYKLAWGVE